MIYRSNLSMPDISANFKLLKPSKMIAGHDAPSDPDFEPECTYWTHDEAAILYNIAKDIKGDWVDIGARFGWTTATLVEAGCDVSAVDTHLCIEARRMRLEQNLAQYLNGDEECSYLPSMEFLKAAQRIGQSFNGFVIDANHDAPEPCNDAFYSFAVARRDCVMMFHDTWGSPIREGVQCLMEMGFNCRMYDTPNGVACLWRGLGNWKPPDHTPDPKVDWSEMRKNGAPEFDFTRCV